jgi:hypothetical protein
MCNCGAARLAAPPLPFRRPLPLTAARRTRERRSTRRWLLNRSLVGKEGEGGGGDVGLVRRRRLVDLWTAVVWIYQISSFLDACCSSFIE